MNRSTSHPKIRRGAPALALVLLPALLAAVLALPSAAPAAAQAAGPTNGALAVNSEDAEVFRTQRIRLLSPEGGAQTPITNASAQEWAPRWSPDGNTLAYYRGFGSWEIVRVEADGTGERAIGFGGHSAKFPVWSVDGRLIYYTAADSNGNDQLWRMKADGTGTERAPLPADVVFGGHHTFAPDGQLVYVGALRDPQTGFAGRPGIYAVDIAAGTAATPRLLTSANNAQSTSRLDVGNDGRVLFDARAETAVTGCFEAREFPVDLYTVPLAGGPVTKLTTTSAFGGPDETNAAWSPDGTQIVAQLQSYACNDRQVVVRGKETLHVLTAQGSVVRDLGFRASGHDWQPCGPSTLRCGPPAQATTAPTTAAPATTAPATTAPATTAPATTAPATTAPATTAPATTAPATTAPATTAPSDDPTQGPEEPVSISLSPAVISAGQTVTATYAGAPGAVVDVLARTQPATEFSVLRRLVLDASGFGTTTHAPQRNTRLTTRTANGTAGAQQPLVQVRSVASLTATRTGTRTYAFAGRVYPARAQRLVNLYRDGRLAAQARTDAQGVYRVARTLAAGTSTFQVRTGDDTYNLGTTRSVRLTVR